MHQIAPFIPVEIGPDPPPPPTSDYPKSYRVTYTLSLINYLIFIKSWKNADTYILTLKAQVEDVL